MDSDPELLKRAETLSPLARAVLLEGSTEPPFSGTLLTEQRRGTYLCALCGRTLFSSESKFDSGSGWPSFTAPVDATHVIKIVDRSHGMVRTEVRCACSAAHLGHVFRDGPPPTGLRFCINSAALSFAPESEEAASAHL